MSTTKGQTKIVDNFSSTHVEAIIKEFKQSPAYSNAETDRIRKAYEFSKRVHAGQKRKSGEPYFIHVYATALQLAQWRLDGETIAAGLLHDTIEDTPTTPETLRKEFGETVAFLVDGVTKLSRIEYHEGKDKNKIEQQAETLRKMMLALSQDIRVILVKLADRLHNMRTLDALSEKRQKLNALETTEIYAPLAYRLGMHHISGELEDLAFPYLHPTETQWLKAHMGRYYKDGERYLEKVKGIVEQALKENNLHHFEVDFRTKRFSSLYKKLLHHNMNVEQIHDIVALRIMVDTVEECYTVLGILHQLWPPLPGRIKDYIALPKPNGYRSLHTTVICEERRPTEFQIRTYAMHQEAEEGIAAHWAYSQTKTAKKPQHAMKLITAKRELNWVNQLRDWQKEIIGSEEFLHALKIDFLKDRIYALTPKGEVIDLPAGATPIDFAYAVHSEIGDSCIGAKVNNKLVSLNHVLQSGDLVEIMTQKSKKPSSSWLGIVKTPSARKKIKASLRANTLGAKTKKRYVEISVTAKDRVGLLKDISARIARSHINIINVKVPSTTHFPTIKAKCEMESREKIERLVLKLKEIEGVREVSHRIL